MGGGASASQCRQQAGAELDRKLAESIAGNWLLGHILTVFARHLAECIRFYEDYQKTAVPDLSIARGHADPAANPGLRADHTWGPFTGSALCKW